MAFLLTSPTFHEGGVLPERFIGDGGNVTPGLVWTAPPPGTRSLALILHDPHSTREPDCVHWVVFDIPPDVGRLPEGRAGVVGLMGRNDFGEAGYGGPRPMHGEHGYVFDLYALDVATLGLASGATHDAVEAAMEGHLLGRANLTARCRGAVGAGQ